MMPTHSFSKDLLKRVWKTKGSRFNAHRRIARKHNASTYIISSSSVHLMALSILPLSSITTITNLSTDQLGYLSFISIVLAIIIFGFGLSEGGKNYGLQSERHHSCGLELSDLYARLEIAIEDNNDEEIKNISSEYSKILEKYSLNHLPIDELYFQSEHADSEDGFPNYKKRTNFEKIKVWFLYRWSDCCIAFFFSVAPIAITLGIIIP